jgi:hypothetical protein
MKFVKKLWAQPPPPCSPAPHQLILSPLRHNPASEATRSTPSRAHLSPHSDRASYAVPTVTPRSDRTNAEVPCTTTVLAANPTCAPIPIALSSGSRTPRENIFSSIPHRHRLLMLTPCLTGMVATTVGPCRCLAMVLLRSSMS